MADDKEAAEPGVHHPPGASGEVARYAQEHGISEDQARQLLRTTEGDWDAVDSAAEAAQRRS